MTEPKTVMEAEDLLKSLTATRRGKLGVCTRKLNETKALLTDGGNVDDVDDCMNMFKSAMDEYNKVHHSLQQLLSGRDRTAVTSVWEDGACVCQLAAPSALYL